MYDLIIDLVHALVRNGWSVSALIAGIYAILKTRQAKKRLRRVFPWLFAGDGDIQNYEQRQIRIEQKIDRLLQERGVQWDADGLKHSSANTAARKRTFSTLRWPGSICAPIAGRFTKSNLRRNNPVKKLLGKLGSRKFWALIAALVTANMVLFGIDGETITKVAAVVTQFGAVVVYILAEASVDREAQRQNVYVVNQEQVQAEAATATTGQSEELTWDEKMTRVREVNMELNGLLSSLSQPDSVNAQIAADKYQEIYRVLMKGEKTQ